MKKLASISMVCCFIFFSNSLKAQFLKNLINNAKQTAQDRANSRANQETNKAIDKVDSAIFVKSAKGNNNSSTNNSNNSGNYSNTNTSASIIDTSAVSKVLGAFSKAAADNPNDTSAADLTMKGLGILTGGGGVSASDSAAAIKSFETSSGGKGYYFESIVITTTQKGTSKDTTKTYITSAGEGREEMKMNIPGAMSASFITIGHAATPTYSISLYPDSKTFALNVIDTALINSNLESYQVTKLGTETIQGYSCTHVKLTSTTGSGMFKLTSTMDLWTSRDVPGYAIIKKMMMEGNVKPDMLQALAKNDCDGYIIKMESSDKDYSMQMQILKAQTKTFPESLFKIPAGYKESDENGISHIFSSVKN